MPLATKTLDDLHAIALGAIRAFITDADTSIGSDYDTSARMVAAVGMLTQAQAQDLARQIFPETSSDEFTLEHAKRVGLFQALAAKSAGKIAVTASAGTSTQALGSALEHGDGTAFTTTTNGTIALPVWAGKTVAPDSAVGRLIVSPDTTGMVADDLILVGGSVRAIREVISVISAIDLYEPLPTVPAAGTVIAPQRGIVIDFIADEVGAAGNKEVGDELTITTPASGVDATARILESSGGGDDETMAELRARIVDRESGLPGGGNVEHVRELARTTPGFRIADAVVFPCFRGLGSTDVVLIGVSGARVVGSAVTAAALAHLEAELPYMADLAALAQELTVAEYDVDVTIETEQGYERDFESSGFAVGVGSTTTRTVLTTNPVGVIEVGDRVLIQVQSAGRWKTLQREASFVGANFIDHEALPAAASSTGPNVHPGGPLAEPAIAALEALFDSLGPSRRNLSPAYTYVRHPLPAVAWDDELRLARIDAVLMALDGCTNVTIATPSSDQQPGAQETIRRGKITLRFTEI